MRGCDHLKMRQLCRVFALLAIAHMMAVPVQSLRAFQHYQFAPVKQGLSSLQSSAGPDRRPGPAQTRVKGRRDAGRQGCLRVSAELQHSVSAVLKSKRERAWQRFATFVRHVLCQAAFVMAFFLFDPGRASAGLVYEGRSAEAINVVYMDKDWYPVEFVESNGEGAMARPHVTAYGRGKENEDVELAVGGAMTKQERRLAAIKHEMAMMKKQREEELSKQPWFRAENTAGKTPQSSPDSGFIKQKVEDITAH